VALKIDLFPHVYPPQTDTFFVITNTRPKPTDTVLELCTGCGIIALHLAQTAQTVHATDVNPYAVANARHNATINNLTNVHIHHGDLYEPVNNRRFDLIVANPPYVPTPPNWQKQDIIEKSWNAGPNGRKLLDRIIAGLPTHLKPDGRFICVQSSLADIPQTQNHLAALGLHPRILAKQWLPFGPISLARYHWLKVQPTFLNPDSELLVVIEAVCRSYTSSDRVGNP
jgi:release factor glutamine methyltransferase